VRLRRGGADYLVVTFYLSALSRISKSRLSSFAKYAAIYRVFVRTGDDDRWYARGDADNRDSRRWHVPISIFVALAQSLFAAPSVSSTVALRRRFVIAKQRAMTHAARISRVSPRA